MNATTRFANDHLANATHRLGRRAGLVALALLGACAEPTTSVAQTEGSSLATTEACTSQQQKLDEATARAPKDATYDAELFVTSVDCGGSFHTAGPSHLSADRLVRIGSNTKSYVAAVTLQYVEAGLVALDQRLDTYLPDAPGAVAPVTVRQLMQHTSGIFNYTETDAFWALLKKDPFRQITPRELVDLALTQPPYFAPGAGWMYSNTNYILLGMMIERLAEAPIATVIRDRILTPNGLTHTFLEGSEPVVGELAPGFDEAGNDVSHTYGLSWAWAAGAMVATPADAARFTELLASGALLTPALQAELTTGVDTPQPGLHYGLGVFLADASITGGAGRAIGHGGDIMGFHSLGFHFPESHMTMFGAVNSDRGSGNDVIAAALQALFSSTAPQRRAPVRMALPKLLHDGALPHTPPLL